MEIINKHKKVMSEEEFYRNVDLDKAVQHMSDLFSGISLPPKKDTTPPKRSTKGVEHLNK